MQLFSSFSLLEFEALKAYFDKPHLSVVSDLQNAELLVPVLPVVVRHLCICSSECIAYRLRIGSILMQWPEENLTIRCR